MSDWIWFGVMVLFGLQMFIIGTTVDTRKWPPAVQAWWWGFTHPFGPPPPWWDDRLRAAWFEANGKPWDEGGNS